MIKAHLQAYETYDKSLALVGYDVVPESPLDEQTIHDALVAFANAGQTQLPAITSFVKKTCKVDLNIATTPTSPSTPGASQ
jgi:hypothetical protein